MKDLRSLRVLVFHPDDVDGKQLTEQLQRVGSGGQKACTWQPIRCSCSVNVDAIFLAVRPDCIELGFDWLRVETVPTLIAVVTYENPTIIETVLHIGAQAVLPSPVRSFGLLSALVVARQLHADKTSAIRKLRKLEHKLIGVRQIAEAKSILMRTRQISDGAAYDLIRDQAMSKRVTTEEIAAAIINANEVLTAGRP